MTFDSSVERAARTSYDSVAVAYAQQVGAAVAADVEMAALFDALVRRSRAAMPGSEMRGATVSRPLIADVGCGPGWWTHRMAQAGARAVGVDVSTAMTAIGAADDARAGAGAGFVVGSATGLPLAAGSFDGVCLWYVLHHLDDAGVRRSLAEVRRICRRGAVVLIGGHLGEGARVKREGYGHPMEVLVAKRASGWWESAIRDAGFDVGDHEVSDDSAHHVVWAEAI